MPIHRDDFLSRPYEEWGQHPHVKAGSDALDWQPDRMGVWLPVILLLGPVLGFCSVFVQYVFFSETLFIWSHQFELWTLTGVALSSVLMTVIVSIAKLRRRIAMRWGSVVFLLPAGLLFGMLFLHPLAGGVAMVWTAVAHVPVEGQVVAAASKRGGGRACRFRNEFYVRNFDGDSFWCSKESLPPAVYQAAVKTSDAGVLILCGEVPDELEPCTPIPAPRPR